MFKTIALGLIAALTLSNVCLAAEGCGDNRWRDEYGHCHWFNSRAGNDRGTHHACPTWAHWDSGRCLHN